MTYLNHPTPVTSTTFTMSQRLAEQPLSLLCMCMPVCFTHVIIPDAVCARTCTSVGIVDILMCFCTHTKLYPQFFVHHSLHCSWGNCSSRPSCVNQLWVEPRKHLKEQSLNVTVTVFHLSWQFVFQGNDEAPTGLARERMKPHSHQRQMLTVLAWSYAWLSD